MLVRLCSLPGTRHEDLTPPLQELWNVSHQTGGDINAAQRWLLPALRGTNARATGWLAVACGYLVENQSDPSIGVHDVLNGLERVIQGSDRTLAEVKATLPETASEAPDALTAALEAHLAVPEQSEAWEALEYYARAAVTFLSFLPQEIVAFRRRPRVMEALDRLRDQTEWADWLWKLLNVPYQETFLVLHPASGRGFAVQVTGVADNFQLHTLLADALNSLEDSGGLPFRRPTPAAVAQASGEPGHADQPVTGVFNLVNWTGIGADGLLPDSAGSPAHWIWNEGLPADIAEFDGQRVILIGEAPYRRSWHALPMFRDLKPSVTVQRTLTRMEVEAWLTRFATRAHRHGTTDE